MRLLLVVVGGRLIVGSRLLVGLLPFRLLGRVVSTPTTAPATSARRLVRRLNPIENPFRCVRLEHVGRPHVPRVIGTVLTPNG